MPEVSVPNVALSDVFRPSADVLSQDVGGEAVLLDLASETYFGLDPIGTRIWQLLGEGHTLQSIRDRLASEYDAPAARIEADLIALVAQLRAAGLATSD